MDEQRTDQNAPATGADESQNTTPAAAPAEATPATDAPAEAPAEGGDAPAA